MNKRETKKKENKDEKIEKIKKVKVAKKKIKKNITNGIAFVNATFNNTDQSTRTWFESFNC